MRGWLSNPYFYVAVFFSLFVGLYVSSYWQQANGKIEEAYEAYTAGENATTLAERSDAFNKALNLYKQMEEVYRPEYGNGRLYYDIGNTYFQLDEYPMAALYYYKALKLSPENVKAHNNLDVVLRKLNIKQEEHRSAFEPIFFFHYYFPLPVRLQIFSLLGVVTIILGSLYVWVRSNRLRAAALFFAVLWTIMTISLLYSRYIEPIDGIMVKASYLYRDAGNQYAAVTNEPIRSGTKVQVLGTLRDGTWFKVETSDGTIGYVSYEALRVI
ncbi:MAG: hypothetical protein H7A37_06105 [Chlamydiales bacterium]|nr:hypothetical protein [Chlamydiia bacterium]MCP5507855.1 hypothetical protein [Chlamydiales bacterium]